MPVSNREESREASLKTGKHANGNEIVPLEDAMEYVRQYARQKPEVFALWCFGVGFMLGWRLKPW